MLLIEAVNIVIATPHLPYPGVPHGGGQDLMALIRCLGERHAVRVAAFVGEAQAAHADALRPYVAEVRLVRPAIGARAKWGQAVAALRTGRLHRLGRRAELEMRATLAGWATDGQAEVLLCGWTEMGRYLHAAPGAVRVLDEVDVRFVVESAAAGRRPWARVRAACRRTEELAYCRAAHLVLTRSARDLAVLRVALPDLQGRVLPPVANTAALLKAPDAGLGEPGRVLFVGALDRARNQRAARWLVEEIWPLVRAAQPAARLRLVGANPPETIRRLAQRPGVEVTGWVPDLVAEYAQARLVAAPMQSEAGALNKVMDALAAGRAVVATPAANAGVGAPPEAICLAGTAASLAQSLIHLLADDQACATLGQAGRRFAAAAFDWPRAASEVEAALGELVARQKSKT